MINEKILSKLRSSAERSGKRHISRMLNAKPKPRNTAPVQSAPPVMPTTAPARTSAPMYRGVMQQVQQTAQAPMMPPPQVQPPTQESVMGRLRMQTGGVAEEPQAPQAQMAPAPQQQEEQSPVGFIEKPTAATTPQETVADDVPMDVPEGSFIINGPAVEFAGSKDVRRMLEDAVEEAKTQGIDIGAPDSTMSNEDYVALLVSKGEVVVPPTLAKIIGYDKLNKINDRGKEEVARRAQEAEQQEPLPAMQGGYIRMRDGGGVVSKT